MSQKAFKLTVRDVLIAARKAMDAGQLQANSPQACEKRCSNKAEVNGIVFYCVIGSALPDSIRENFPFLSIDALAGKRVNGKYITDNPEYDAVIDITTEDLIVLNDLQKRHDAVVSAVSLGSNKFDIAQSKKRFRDQFRKLEIKHGLRPARAA